MAILPQFQTQDKDFQLMQSRWSSILNPILGNPIASSNILKSIPLINGVTVVNHLLGRKMQGWAIVDINAAATIYRSQPMNSLTLTLTSNAACVVDLMVY